MQVASFVGLHLSCPHATKLGFLTARPIFERDIEKFAHFSAENLIEVGLAIEKISHRVHFPWKSFEYGGFLEKYLKIISALKSRGVFSIVNIEKQNIKNIVKNY